MRCASCGLESTWEEGFYKSRLTNGRPYCPVCATQKYCSLYQAQFTGAIVLAVIGAVFVLISGSGVGWLFLAAGTFQLVGIPLAYLHELGHVAAAIALRMSVFQINLGSMGKPLWEKNIGSCEIVVRKALYGGYVVVLPRTRRLLRMRVALITLGGPTTDFLVLVVAVFGILPHVENNWFAKWLVAIFVFYNLISLFWTLVPHRIWLAGRRTPNDGLLILQSLFGAREALEGHHAAYFYMRHRSLSRGKSI